MSYIEPDNLEAIQNFLQDAGPRGQISPEDTSNFAAPINVSFVEEDLSPLVEKLDELTCNEWSKHFPPLDKVLVVADEGIGREAIAIMRDLCMERDIALITPSTALTGLHQHMLERLTQDSVLPLFDAEKIQALTDTAREFGGIVDKDVVMTVPSGAHVKFTKPDLALAEMRKPGWFRKQPVRTLGEAENGSLEGRRVAQLRTFESMLNQLELPKSSPTGRVRLSPINPYFDSNAVDSWVIENIKTEQAPRIRGLLRSKTKKGPKRRYAGR